MDTITTVGEAITAIRTYERELVVASYPVNERLAASLELASTKISPVELVVTAAEALYAFRKDLDNQGLELCYQLASYCNMMGFHLLGGSRGTAICKALLRDMGAEPPAGVEWPEPETDPEPSEGYLAPATTMPTAPPTA